MPLDLDELPHLPFSRFDELARGLVELDAEVGDEPLPRVAGYHGEDPLAVIDLRPFPPGGVDAPVIEALAGLLALGADRLAAALPGRAWSLDDPIPPVGEDCDLRQRVVMVATASRGHGLRTWLQPYEHTGASVAWGDPTDRLDGPVEGWVPAVLDRAVQAGWELDARSALDQLERCATLGHRVLLTDAAVERLGQAGR